MADLIFYSQYTATKAGKTGLTVTADVWRITRASGATSEIVAAAEVAEVGDGIYLYRLAAADPTTYDYVAVFKTADTSVDNREIPSLWTQFGIESSLKANAVTAASLDADAVAEIQNGLATAAGLEAIGDPLTSVVPGSYASGSAGAALGRIGSGQITTISPMAQGGDIVIIVGDDYAAADARALSWTDAGAAWPVLTGAEIAFIVDEAGSYAGSVITGTGSGKEVRVELTAAETAQWGGALHSTYQVVATLETGRVITLASGNVVVQLRVSA